jgi:hypothetical protein
MKTQRLSVALAILAVASSAAHAQACKSALTPFFEFQVERPAKFVGDTTTLPRPAIHQSPATATLVVMFVVDTIGTVREGTLRILKSPSPEASDAVGTAYTTWKYVPAVLGGCKVAQLVQTEVVH